MKNRRRWATPVPELSLRSDQWATLAQIFRFVA